MRLIRVLLTGFCLTLLAPVSHAELTFLSSTDKYSSIQLTSDKLGVSYTEFNNRSVRSTKAVQPGSGFYYFEGTRYVTANIGWAVTTATPGLSAQLGLDNQSLAINTGNGTFWSSNAFQGNIVNVDTTYGIAVAYRGAHPIVHVIGVATVGGPDVYLGSYTLSAVTDPVYIGIWGAGPAGQLRQRINAGDNLGTSPFRYDPVAVLTAAYYHPINGEDELVLGWGTPDPGLNRFPVLTPGPPQTVVLGNAVTVGASASDAEDGNLSAAVSYLADEGPTGSGPSFQWTPTTLGDHLVTLTITDSGGASRSATIAVTVIASTAVDNDGDGLDFAAELLLGTNPSLADTDGDGLLDGKEAIYYANPLLADSDGDGLEDRYEALSGTRPDRDDTGEDPDGDGDSNLEEALAGSRPLDASSTVSDGVVALDPTDKAAGVALEDGGHVATFGNAKGAAMMAARSTIAIAPGSGWYYYEGLRETAPGNFGFGVASASESLDHFGGQTNQSFGVFTNGGLFYNNIQVNSFTETATTAVYGLAVNYSGAHPVVHVIAADALGQPAPIAPVTLSGISGDLYLFVFGESGTQVRIDAGKDPDGRPFAYAADYELVLDGYAGAEFLGTGWGSQHTYSGRPVPRQFERVYLDRVETPAGADINLGPDQLSCSYTQNLKMAIRANTGMVGQFRYWEARRDTNAGNYGQGYISAHAYLSPYCCVSVSLTGAPPSMSLNSSANIWRNLVSQASYDISNTYYGFAVDYRGSRPIVYVILGNALARTMLLDDFFRPIYPMIYGNTQGFKRTNSANFGAQPFNYDARTILTNAGVDTTELILGWGDVNDNQTPRITGQQQVQFAEGGSRAITLTDLDTIDPSSKRGSLTLTVANGSNYSRSGATITPAPDFYGNLLVPVTVSDGTFTSHSYDLIVEVTPVNDPPQISGQAQAVSMDEDATLAIPPAALTVTDIDDTFPDDFTILVEAGAHYTFQGDEITPESEYSGPLTVNLRVNDGQADSNTFALAVTVDAVNDQPEIDSLAAPLSVLEENSLTLTLADLNVTDPDNSYPGDFSLSVGDGQNYQRAGNSITPDQDYVGQLTVPVQVSDGETTSPIFMASVTVLPGNDAPVITAQQNLKIAVGQTLEVLFAHLTVNDPDNDYPDDFSLSVGNGANYTHVGRVVTPDPGFTGTLSVSVTVNDGSDDSAAFPLQLEVCELPGLDLLSMTTEVCMGEGLSIQVLASGSGPFTYQWRKDGVDLPGKTSATLLYATAIPTMNGTYDCQVTNACGTRLSSSTEVTVREYLFVTQPPLSQSACPGESVSFQVEATGTGPISYQWRKNGVDIPLATTAVYTIDELEESDAGAYTCAMENPCGSVVSLAANLTVDGPLEVGITPSSGAAGLEALSLSSRIGCALHGVHWVWRDITHGQTLGQDIDPLVIDPPPSSTTVYELTVTDDVRRETVAARTTVLVAPDAIFLDLNGDGCNDNEDLWLLGQDWREDYEGDPTGNGIIDVRDLLYLDVSSQGPSCP